MNFFRAFFLPLAYLLYSVRFWGFDERRDRRNAFLRGCIGFVPALLLFLIIRPFFSFDYGSFALIVGVAIRDTVLWPVLACGAYGLFYRYGDAGLEESKRNLVSFLCGFLSLVAIYEWMAGDGHASIYTLFMLPVLRASMVLGVAAIAARAFDEIGAMIGVFIAFGLLFLFSVAFVGFFWLNLHYLFSFLFFLAACLAGWFIYDRLD
jgi:hypothetical protein